MNFLKRPQEQESGEKIRRVEAKQNADEAGMRECGSMEGSGGG